MKTPEQKARDLLERMEVPNAQDYTAGELVELANLFIKDQFCKYCKYWDLSSYECDFPINRMNDDRNPIYRVVRRCGPEFGCISFEYGNKLLRG